MILSIDLGGTNVRIAQVENGRCLNKTSVACPAQQDASAIIGLLIQLIKDSMNEQVKGIGIGVPSIADPEKGIVYNVTNISSWKEIHLKEILTSEFALPVAINNDSNCFTLGVKNYGEGRAFANMVGMTIGTGIGAGVIINHHLYGGQYLGAGEVGAFPYLDADFEHYCSSYFFRQHHTTGAEAARKAGLGEPDALEIWQEFGRHLGNLMKAILYAYAPQAIILGGGIAPAFSLFRGAMEKEMQNFPYKVMLNNLKVMVSKQQDAGLLGASILLQQPGGLPYEACLNDKPPQSPPCEEYLLARNRKEI